MVIFDSLTRMSTSVGLWPSFPPYPSSADVAGLYGLWTKYAKVRKRTVSGKVSRLETLVDYACGSVRIEALRQWRAGLG